MSIKRYHEFLHPLEPVYRECKYCGERKSLVCLRCGYCYECHPIIEEMELRNASYASELLQIDEFGAYAD